MKHLIVAASVLFLASQASAADLRIPRSMVQQYLQQQAMMQQQPPAPGCQGAPQGVLSAAFHSAVCAALLPFHVGQMMITGAAMTVQQTGIVR
jgi:hypothetical protein